MLPWSNWSKFHLEKGGLKACEYHFLDFNIKCIFQIAKYTFLWINMNHPQTPQMCCLSCFFVGEDLRQIPDLVSKNCLLGACARAGKWMEVLNSKLHVRGIHVMFLLDFWFRPFVNKRGLVDLVVAAVKALFILAQLKASILSCGINYASFSCRTFVY